MAAPLTATDLRTLIERSGLLSTEQLEPWFSNGDSDPDAITFRLLAERLLTPFQARQLQKGRTDGFFLTDKYKVLDFIGSGGMGQVYLCEHLILHRLVGVKLLQLATGSGMDAARAFDRFFREARAVAALKDPNIIQVFDVDRVGPNPFMVMEYVDGTNLHDIVAKHGPLTPIRAAEYIRQAALGLQHAHEVGLIHRDIKPGNLLLDRSGTVKLLDLGLARFTDDPTRNQGITDKYDKHIVVGTADFMAPEQAFEIAAVDIRSDIYALGCTMYFLLSGRVPFPDRSVPEKMYAHKTRAPAPVSELCPRLPVGLAAVLDKMIAKEPGERYQTPATVVEALAESVVELVDPPPAHEMPEHPAAFYRLGLTSAAAEPSPSALAVTPNPLSQAETMPAPRPPGGDLPPFHTPPPRAPSLPPAADSSVPSIVLTPPPPAQPRIRSLRLRRRLVRLAELLLFVLAAGGVGWLASREWMHRPVQQGPQSNPPVVAPKGHFTGPVVNGGGVTFVDPVIQRWSEAYEKQRDVRVDYQPVGMGKGVKGVFDRVYLFGCTVVPLTDKQLAEAGGDVMHIPLALGAIAVAYNLPDVGELKFTGPVLADIYLGKVTRWNDPALVVSNPGVALPDLPITVVYHDEPTGTKYLWTDFLSFASAEYKAKYGAKAEFAWPVGTWAKANDGTATVVSRTIGAIGYLEQSFALANNLRVGRIKNKDGKFVAPTPAGVTAAAAWVLRTIPDDLRYSLTDAPGEDAYPVAGTVWAILYADQTTRPNGRELVDFLRWATHEGQAYATELNFAPLPPDLVKRIDDRLAAVRVK